MKKRKWPKYVVGGVFIVQCAGALFLHVTDPGSPANFYTTAAYVGVFVWLLYMGGFWNSGE